MPSVKDHAENFQPEIMNSLMQNRALWDFAQWNFKAELLAADSKRKRGDLDT